MNYNPGAPAAIAEGCICPMLRNDCGDAPPHPPHGWLVRTDCPLHGTMTTYGLVQALSGRVSEVTV
jgi:hypothetical protein